VCYDPRDIHPVFAGCPPQHVMRVCYDKCYDKIALSIEVWRKFLLTKKIEELFLAWMITDLDSGQQWFFPQPQSAWSRTELLIENCLPAKHSDQGIQQQHVTKSNTTNY
jgi:hypothetical protein